MGLKKIVAIVLILAGVAALAIGKFHYTKDKNEVELGPLKLQAKQQEEVKIPVWLGAGLVLVGAGILVFDRKR